MVKKIYKYWSSRIDGLSAGCCFRCGYKTKNLEAAHITARVNGGSNSPDNLHLLCSLCHTASELKEGKAYWSWFRSSAEPIRYYRELLALNHSTRAAQWVAAKRKRKEKLGGDVPYGYRLSSKNTLEPEPEEQRAIELMRQLRDAGTSYEKIGLELQRRGIISRRGKRHWNGQVVKQILRRTEDESTRRR